jgi:ABC transporter substrate binding protein
VELAARQRLPALYEVRSFADEGGLVSYGPDLTEMYRRAASYVDRIFKGAKPGELAIEQPGKFEMVINLKTAKALGRDSTVAATARRRSDSVMNVPDCLRIVPCIGSRTKLLRMFLDRTKLPPNLRSKRTSRVRGCARAAVRRLPSFVRAHRAPLRLPATPTRWENV